MSLIAVTGMQREAKLFPPGCEIVVSGGSNAALAEKIEAALARSPAGQRCAIVSAGICGGLKPGLAVGAAVIATEIVFGQERYATDADWRAALSLALPHAGQGALAGSDRVVATAADKADLFGETGAVALDMESHVAARIAAVHGLPFAALRVVSDSAQDVLPDAVRGAIDSRGEVRISRVLLALAGDPAQLPALIRTGRASSRAMQQLLRCFDLAGIGLGCPHLG